MARRRVLRRARCRAVDSRPPHARAREPAAACLGARAAVLWVAGRRLLRRARGRAVDSWPPPAQACEVPCCRGPAAACLGVRGAVL
eukprot:3268257-Prymnesium_polylepis.1